MVAIESSLPFINLWSLQGADLVVAGTKQYFYSVQGRYYLLSF
jgi:hypothetical protein